MSVRLRHYLEDLRRWLNLRSRTDDQAAVLRLMYLLHEPKCTPGQVRWRKRLLHYADGTATYSQLADIHVNHCYDFASQEQRPHILDVGGHIGLASLHFRKQFPAADITVFEPDPGLARLLRANLAATADGQTHVETAAAWIRDGEVSFHSTGDDSGRIRTGTNCGTVPCVDLAHYCTPPVDYLKLDIEGAEFAVLEHLKDRGVLGNVQRLFVELHAWQSAMRPEFHHALNVLADADFDYRIVSAETFPSAGTTAIDPASTHNLVAVQAWRPSARKSAVPETT